MSHEYYLVCKRCNDVSGDYNHGQTMLVNAVKQSGILHALSKTDWSGDMEFNGHRGLSRFLMDHYEHGGFIVRSEYHSVANPSEYPDIEVYPEPESDYAKVCLPIAASDLEALQERLTKLKAMSEASHESQ